VGVCLWVARDLLAHIQFRPPRLSPYFKMTIKEIGYTEKIMKNEERKKEERAERKKYGELVKEFNKKAKELKSPYKIKITYKHPHLIKIVDRKLLFWKYQEDKELNQLVYINRYTDNDNYFVFFDGLDIKTFKEIEDILNSIDIKFEVKLKSGKIPTKYKIIEELGK